MTAEAATDIPTKWRLAKIKDAADTYGLEERYMRRLVEERRVATVKLGRYRLVDLDSLDRLINAGYTPALTHPEKRIYPSDCHGDD